MSELKFKLTAESKVNLLGVKLFRIEALVDFVNNGRQVKKGDKGGWLQSEKVNGNARVSGNAWVSGDAQVFGDARVSGNAWVSGNARVFGDAQVSGNAHVSGDARVSDNAQVSGNAWVSGDAKLSLKKAYKKGLFLHSTDGEIKPTIIDCSEVDGFDGDRDYKNLLVVGDYEIEDIEEPKTEVESVNTNVTTPSAKQSLVTIQIGDNGLSVPRETAESLRDALNAVLD